VRQLGQQSVTKDIDTNMMERCSQVLQSKLQLEHLKQYFRAAGESQSAAMLVISRLPDSSCFSALPPDT
jgi:hypothetical protein